MASMQSSYLCPLDIRTLSDSLMTSSLTEADVDNNDSLGLHPDTQSIQHLYTQPPTIGSISRRDNTLDQDINDAVTKSSPQKVNEDLMSRGDVFAGVIVFSIGILVMVIAITYYFANGGSLRIVRRNRRQQQNGDGGVQNESNGASGGQEIREVNPAIGIDYDLECNAPSRTAITMNSNSNTIVIPSTGKDEIQVVGKESTFDPSTPSTVHLIDHSAPHTSVFAFIKGTYYPPSNANPKKSQNNTMSILGKTGDKLVATTDSKATVIHMPILTRTKARSSCKRKSKGMIHFFTNATSSSLTQVALTKKQKQKMHATTDSELTRNTSSIIIQVQEPTEPEASSLPIETTIFPFENVETCSTIKDQDYDLDSQLDDHPPEDIFSPIDPTYEPSLVLHTTPLLRLEMPTTIRSSSIVGLYGSAKSSPNGSMLDAASTCAIYCTSLKSAVSFLPTGSTSTLGVLNTADLGGVGAVGRDADVDVDEREEIVIATAGLSQLDENATSIAIN
ncbi:hypothetical protein FBU30_009934 [Linnemannia zychae]|nr:hypothetical protein FBU30_009934 [Linnemannia zychae]